MPAARCPGLRRAAAWVTFAALFMAVLAPFKCTADTFTVNEVVYVVNSLLVSPNAGAVLNTVAGNASTACVGSGGLCVCVGGWGVPVVLTSWG